MFKNSDIQGSLYGPELVFQSTQVGILPPQSGIAYREKTVLFGNLDKVG